MQDGGATSRTAAEYTKKDNEKDNEEGNVGGQ